MKQKTKKITISILIALTVFLTGICWYTYKIVSTGFNIKTTTYIYIDQNLSYNKLLDQIQSQTKITDIDALKTVASYYDYPQHMKTGRYAIEPKMTTLQLIKILKSGQQTAVKLTFNNIRTKEDLTERISQQLMLQDSSLLKTLNDPTKCKQLGFTPQNIVAMFIPNTYQVYWNVSQDSFLKRMNSEYKKFWTNDRITKAKALNLSPTEVATLASIVEEECYFTDEYPIVAGLYLNRLKKGMLLQADPTVKFAVGDFSLKRILNKHLAIESPYNTYKHTGLPPGPIRIPSLKSLNAVLNPTGSNYYYMCAKEDFSNRHNFASTLNEHLKNAAKYQKALNQHKIY